MTTATLHLGALVGGVLIGGSLAFVAALTGRSLGVTGMAAAVLAGNRGERAVPAAFLAGMVACGGLLGLVFASFAADHSGRPGTALLVGGILVGFGAREANGCTSGHGIVGVARGSARSFVAIALFALAASLVAAVLRGVSP